MNKIRINVGRVRTAMAAKGLTAQAAAAQIGMPAGSFVRIMREGMCAPFMMGRIAKVLDIPVWELVDR